MRHWKEGFMVEVKAYEGLIRNHVELADELGVEIEGAGASTERQIL